jgi:glycosyltransferase involved in cell wall biosynthesis
MPKKIAFVVGSANLSGGTYVIFQHASYLKNAGYEVTIALVYMTLDELNALRNSPTCWHPAIKILDFIHINDCFAYQFDIAIYTWWATILSFEKMNASSFIYFVQSIESRFYHQRDTFLKNLADKTYQLNLPIITEATWIKHYLEKHYNATVYLAKNGILKDIYESSGATKSPKLSNKLRLLVEGPIEAPYKNVIKTIELCKQVNVGEIWLLTSSAIDTYPGVARIYSRIPITETAEVYRSCDVLVKLSTVEGMFGPPLEMFHCGGTAIVYAVSGHDEYIKHNYNALVAAPDDEQAVINYLSQLATDKMLLKTLKENAVKTAASWQNWTQASAIFMQQIELASKNSPGYDQFHTSVNQAFSQELMISTTTENITLKQSLTAKAMYDNAHYLLSIPLAIGTTTCTIHFGKKYKEFKILNIFSLRKLKRNSMEKYT